jgi:hypothetical protein
MNPTQPKTQSIYYPNYFVGLKKIASDGYNFEGYSKRKPLHKNIKP